MPKTIFIAASPGFIFVATILYASAILAILLSAILLLLQIIIILLLIFDYWWVVIIYGLRRHANSINILSIDCEHWRYQNHAGKDYQGRLLVERSYSSSWIIILYIKHLYHGRYIIIPRDSISKHNYSFLAYKLNCE